MNKLQMNKLQKYIHDQHIEHGRSFTHLHEKVFDFMSRMTFHVMKKTGDITRMPVWKALEMSKITGMSIEEMMSEATTPEVLDVGEVRK